VKKTRCTEQRAVLFEQVVCTELLASTSPWCKGFLEGWQKRTGDVKGIPDGEKAADLQDI